MDIQEKNKNKFFLIVLKFIMNVLRNVVVNNNNKKKKYFRFSRSVQDTSTTVGHANVAHRSSAGHSLAELAVQTFRRPHRVTSGTRLTDFGVTDCREIQ